ncbi:hypothetical protein AAE478_007357 [Parahypoxylon ruwenzoriense]
MPHLVPLKPLPFAYSDDDGGRNLPDLDDEEFGHLTAVLKALARGSYPRLEAVPLALNAYNCNQRASPDANADADAEPLPWAYFYPITVVAPEDVPLRVRPIIDLDARITEDLGKPWCHVRFLCFIHKHKINRKATTQKGVHTISIWDREWDELTWHDTYHISRSSRRREIQRFWEFAEVTGFPSTTPREEFMERIRYRTVYHVAEHIEDTLRNAIPPRHTLWAVCAAALHHMNNARDPHVSIVPDKLELFGGQARGLLPRLFAHLLWLCLDARPEWGRGEQERFVGQCRILDRLAWMRLRTRHQLRMWRDRDREGEGSSDGEGDGERERERDREWVYDILRL